MFVQLGAVYHFCASILLLKPIEIRLGRRDQSLVKLRNPARHIQGDPKKNGPRVFRIIRIGARFFLGHPVQ